MKARIILMTLVLGVTLAQTSQAGFLGHVAAYTAAGIAAHEAERYIDHRHSQPVRDGEYNQGTSDESPVYPISRALPDPKLTPGRISTAVTQDNLDETICRRGGYTRSVRPPESYTEKLKREQIREYGYGRARLSFFEEDHAISLEIGGSPDSPQNLWPEPHNVEGGWGSYAKDQLENRLHDLVCSRQISLADAQRAIATNWIDAYKRYIGPNPPAGHNHP